MRPATADGVTIMAKVPVLVPEGNLGSYLQEIRKFPMLEQNEEYMLAKSWRARGDTEAAHNLVTSHLPLVSKTAMVSRGLRLPLSELTSEPNREDRRASGREKVG